MDEECIASSFIILTTVYKMPHSLTGVNISKSTTEKVEQV